MIAYYLTEFYKFRELLFTLTKREIKVRYKQTFLGASWAIFQPLSLMIIFTLIFSVFLKLESPGVPYTIFSYSALLPWTFFSTGFSFGALALVNNSNLITKVYFPREVLPLSSVLAAFIDFLVANIIFVGMMLYYKIPLTINLLYLIPIILVLIVFTSAAVLFSSAFVVLVRDIKFVIPLLIQLWIFATPVTYPISRVPDNLRVLYVLDPLAALINSFRNVTVYGIPPSFYELASATIVSFVFLFLSYLFFKQKERIFADII